MSSAFYRLIRSPVLLNTFCTFANQESHDDDDIACCRTHLELVQTGKETFRTGLVLILHNPVFLFHDLQPR